MVCIEQLSFGYGKVDLFDRLKLTIRPGTIYGLLGKNGAGKTSLLKIVTGVLIPRKGTVSVFGREPRKRQPDFLVDVCLVPEEFYVPKLTVEKYQSVWGGFYPRFDGEAFHRYLSQFDVDPAERLSSMSYGQKKKVLIAFAVATNCRLVLLDEPTNGLDIPAKRQFRRLVAGAVDEQRTFVVSTHQVRDMAGLIDPVVIIDDGQVVLNAKLDELGRAIRIDTGVDSPPADAIYIEESISGHTVIAPNHGEPEGLIDLEVLFNAATSNSGALATLVQEVKDEERESHDDLSNRIG